MKLPWISRRRHLEMMIEAEARVRASGLSQVERVAAEARGNMMIAKRFSDRLERDLDDAKKTIEKLMDTIVELKREGRELPHPPEERWRTYTTEEADQMRMAEIDSEALAQRTAIMERPEHHEQIPSTDGGAHTGYIDALELERAAQRALESELPDVT